ncbi:DUF1653 domain-containing protein [bacterium]|nr:DUF1653 domain-containing protein [bacterium]
MADLSEIAQNFKHGTYRHFKGGIYKTICIGRSSEERDQEFVVYQSLDRGHIWIRPLPMFIEEVDRDGYKGPRFSYVAES